MSRGPTATQAWLGTNMATSFLRTYNKAEWYGYVCRPGCEYRWRYELYVADRQWAYNVPAQHCARFRGSADGDGWAGERRFSRQCLGDLLGSRRYLGFRRGRFRTWRHRGVQFTTVAIATIRCELWRFAVGPNGEVIVTYGPNSGSSGTIYTTIDPDGLGPAGFSNFMNYQYQSSRRLYIHTGPAALGHRSGSGTRLRPKQWSASRPGLSGLYGRFCYWFG